MGLPSPAVAAWRRGRSLVPGVTSGVNREHRQASVTTETNTAGRATAKPRASRVAVLEDDVTLRDAVLLPLLRDHGFEAVGMGSAAELYRCMLRTQFDIVLLDIGLPGENGLEVASNLRQLSVGLGIVMLTGSRGRDKRVRAFNHGVDAYLTKPVDGAVLGAMLHSLSRRLSISRPGLRETGVLERFEQDVQSRRWRLETGGWCLVAPNGAMLALSAHERSLLTLLINAGGQPVPRDRLLLALAGGDGGFDPHRLEMLVHRLRRKAAALSEAGEPLPLLSSRGNGYLFAGLTASGGD